MMPSVQTPQSRCRAAIAKCDITPPVGIYHRMWGAALHDRATGVHRPLEARLLWLAPFDDTAGSPQIIVSLDHCILDTPEQTAIRQAIAHATALPVEQVLVTLTHTHGSGWMSRTRSQLPGGDLIGPYLDGLATQLADVARSLPPQSQPVTMTYGIGRCDLAAERDYFDVERDGFVCGYHPGAFADDTLLIARLSTAGKEVLATIVNYACHPTTLAWENTLLSPDWVGAMREVVEQHGGGTCLFLQGASGDLGPKEGFVGDPAVADRNGRQVGYAALSALEGLPPAGTEFCYTGAVVSGATLGTWSHQPLGSDQLARHQLWSWETLTVELPYRHDLPTVAETTAARDEWTLAEERARSGGDDARVRDCRAQIEQRTRQLARLAALSGGRAHPLTVHIGQMGDALWILLPGELYQVFQSELRRRFAPRPVIVATLTNEWQPGYIPPARVYGYGIYQEVIASVAAGNLEILIEAICRKIS